MTYFSKFLHPLLIVAVVASTIPVVFTPSVAEAAFNKQINYQGKLTTAANIAVSDGDYSIRFKLYTAASGGVAIWTESWCYTPDSGTTCDGTGTDGRVAVTSGLFSVLLGSTSSLANVDFNQTLYLGVEIGGSAGAASWDGEMAPRKKLGVVPAAVTAENIGGLNNTQFIRSDAANATTSASTYLSISQSGAGKIAEFFGPSSNSVLSILSGGNVGIGTTSPYAKLSVAGDVVADRFIATSTTGTSTFAGGLAVSGALSLTGRLYDGSASAGTNGYVLQTTGSATQWVATSSLGFASTLIGTTGQVPYFSGTNLAAGTSTIFISTAGKVGINVTGTPTRRLQVQDLTDGFSFGDGTFERTRLWRDGAGQINLDFYESTGGAAANIRTLDASMDLTFAPNSVERMRVTTAGNVGIGTTSPYAKLSVVGPVVAEYFHATSTTATSTFAGGILGPGSFTVQSLSGRVGVGSTSPILPLSVVSTGGSSAYFAGNVGIGISAPSSLLHVNGASFLNGATVIGTEGVSGNDFGLTLNGGLTGSTNITFVFEVADTGATGLAGKNLLIRGTSGASDIAFAPSSGLAANPSLVLKGNGNIGVGTTSPGARLSVAGASLGTVPLFMISSSTASATTTTFYVGSNGRVGINTGAPTGLLHVQGSIGNGFSVADNGGVSLGFLSAATNVNSQRFTNIAGSAASPALAGIDTGNDTGIFMTTGDVIGFSTNAVETVRIDSTGSLGIGTTSPLAKLSVNSANATAQSPLLYIASSSAAVSTSTYFMVNALGNVGIGTANPAQKLSIETGSVTTKAIYVTYGGSGEGFSVNEYGRLTSGAANIAARFGDATDHLVVNTDFLIVKNGGNVGIGTTSPYAKLSVVGEVVASHFTGTTTATSTFGGNLAINGTGTTTSAGGFNLSAGCFAIGGTCLSSGVSSQWTTAGNNIYYSTGAVGIGTSSPFASLAINPIAGQASNQFVIGSSTATSFIVTNAGTVGIGTLTPATSGTTGGAPLEVRGSSFLQALFTSSGSAGGIGLKNSSNYQYEFQSDPSNRFTVYDRNAAQYRFNIESTGQVSLGSLAGEKFILTSTGSVGIGTTSPLAKLSVNSANATAQSPLFYIASSSAAVSTSTYFIVNALGNVGIGTTTPFGKLSVSTASSASSTTLFSVASSTNATLFNVLGNGYVGIGTSYPIEPLHINLPTGASGIGARFTAVDNTIPAMGFYRGSQAAASFKIDFPTNLIARIATGDAITQFAIATASTTFSRNASLSFGSADVGSGSDTALIAHIHTDNNTGALNLKTKSSGVFHDTLFLSSAGNVGVGTTTPWGALAVNNFSAGASTLPLFVISSSTAAGATSTQFIVDRFGNVGIGTTSPTEKLVLTGPNINLQIHNSNATLNTSGWFISEGRSGCFDGYFTISTSSTCLANPAFQITDAGAVNFGNGMSVTDSKYVGSNSSASIAHYMPYDGVDTAEIIFRSRNGSGNTGKFNISSYAYFGGLHTEDMATFWTTSDTRSAPAIELKQKVGIGSTTPFSTLSISTTTSSELTSLLSVASSTNATLFNVLGGGTVGIGTTSPYASLSVNTVAGKDPFAVGSSTGNYLRVTKNGELVLGTTTTGCLNTSSAGVVYAATCASGTSFGKSWEIDAAGYLAPTTTLTTLLNNGFVSQASSTIVGNFNVSGLVGIASTTPWANLAINPTAGSASNQFVIGSSTATSFIVNNSGFGGFGTTTPWAQLSINPNGLTGPAFAIGSSTGTRFLVTNGGNVGIGTTTPFATLAVNPTAGRASNQFVVGSSTATSLLIGNNGNISIGTSTLATRLNVAGGDVAFNLSSGSATLYTVGTPASANASGDFGFTYTASGYTHSYRIYAYRTVNGNTFFSSSYASASMTDGNDASPYDVQITWSTAANADGYRILKQDDTGSGCNFDCYADVPGGGVASTFDGGGFVSGSTVTPTSYTSTVATSSDFYYNYTTGRIGIGSSTPNSKLVVVSAAAGDGILVDSTGSNSPSIQLGLSGGVKASFGYANASAHFSNLAASGDSVLRAIGTSNGAFRFSNQQSGDFVFETGSTAVNNVERARLTSAGRFGIGTSSPYAPLSVVGQIVGAYFTGTTTATSTFGGNLAINGTGTSTSAGGLNLTAGCFAIAGTCISGGGGSGTINSGTTNRLSYYSGATAVSSANFLSTDITNSRFGIGSTTPFGQLSIETTAGTSSFVIGSSTATHFIVDKNGNVGINKLVPAAKLFVVETSSAATNPTIIAQATSTTGVNNLVQSWQDTEGNTLVSVGTQVDAVGGRGYITVSNPGADGNGSGIKFSSNGGTKTGGLFQQDSSGNLVFRNGNSGAGTYFDYASGALHFRQSGFTETLGIDNNGKTGFSSTTPFAFLSVNPVAGAASNQFVVGSSTATSFIINNSGNIGIGTTSPYASLSVVGASGVVANQFFATSTTATSTFAGAVRINQVNGGIGLALSRGSDTAGGTGFLIRARDAADSVDIFSLTTKGALYTGSTFTLDGAQASGALITASSTVAVANNTFSAFSFKNYYTTSGSGSMFLVAGQSDNGGARFTTLDVAPTINHTGSAGFSTLRVSPYLLATGSGSKFLLDVGTNSAANGGGTHTSLFTINSAGNVGISTTTPWANLAVNPIAGAASNQFVVGSSTATSFLINNAGRVGVGTTSPTANLFSVAGDMYIGGSGANSTSTIERNLNVLQNLKVGTGSITFIGNSTSTFSSGGINVTNGCFAIAGTCIGAGGGSTNSAGGTGAVQFANGTSFAADVANFFWDDSNNRLGIGSSTPATPLSVNGRIGAGGLTVYDSGSWGDSAIMLNRPSDSTSVHVEIAPSTGGLLFRNFDSGQAVQYDFRNASDSSLMNISSGGTVTATAFVGDGSGLTGIVGGSSPFSSESYGAKLSSSNDKYLFIGSGSQGTPTAGGCLQIFGATLCDTGDAFHTSHKITIDSGDMIVSSGSVSASGDVSGATIQGQYGATCSDNSVDSVNGIVTNCGTYSDIRLKKNVTALTGTLAKLDKLSTISYNWNDTYNQINPNATTTTQYGLVAQEVAEVFPEFVAGDGQYLKVNYGKFIPLLVDAVKELNLKVDILSGTSTLATSTPWFSAMVASAFDSFGAKIEQGIVKIKSMFVENLAVGTKEKPAGITLFDQSTGEPYCLSVRNGSMQSLSGECNIQLSQNTPAPAPIVVTPPSSNGGTATTTIETPTSTPTTDSGTSTPATVIVEQTTATSTPKTAVEPGNQEAESVPSQNAVETVPAELPPAPPVITESGISESLSIATP